MPLRDALKRILLPSERQVRRFPFGLSAGIRMHVDFSHQTRLFLGLYEIEIAGHCKRLMQPCDSAFDIGADAGYYSLILGKQTGGKVVAVEPETENISQLRDNIGENDFLITAVQAFVRAEVDEGAVTLNQLSDEHFKPDFIKMDIEGGEADALRGGLRLIEEHRPHMIIEVHSEDLEAECKSLLAPFGYKIAYVPPRKWLPELRVDAFNGWLICEGSPGQPS